MLRCSLFHSSSLRTSIGICIPSSVVVSIVRVSWTLRSVYSVFWFVSALKVFMKTSGVSNMDSMRMGRIFFISIN